MERNIHKMRLVDFAFNAIKNGEKDIEIRLNDEKRQLIKIGDIIEFEHIDTKEIIKVRVVNLYLFNTFKELINNLDKHRLGLNKDDDEKICDNFYTKEEQTKYQVLGIEIKLINNEGKMENVIIKELTLEELDQYDTIPFGYVSNQKYVLKKINRGLGGILLELKDIVPYDKKFDTTTSKWKEWFNLDNWKFYVAILDGRLVGGAAIATKTHNCNMLEKRDDLAVLWDIRVDDNFKHQGIGQKLFDTVIDFAKGNDFKQFKIECQNTNVPAVNFYHKQGAVLGAINEYAYPDNPGEVQLLFYIDL